MQILTQMTSEYESPEYKPPKMCYECLSPEHILGFYGTIKIDQKKYTLQSVTVAVIVPLFIDKGCILLLLLFDKSSNRGRLL